MNRWAWLARYAVAALLALVLAGLLGGSQLFQNARVAAHGPTAADLVRFFGSGAALLLLWLAADRAARTIPEDGSQRSLVRHALLPLATLIVLALAYPVPLLLVGPVLSEPSLMVYRWLFVLGITAAGVWLVLTVSRDADALAPVLSRAAARLRQRRGDEPEALAVRSKAAVRCATCGELLPPGETTCARCGRRAAA